MFELDFSEIGVDDLVLSQADQTFLTIVTQAIHHRKDSHYEIPLPFKDMDMNLPNNKAMALQCLMKHLKRRVKHDEKYRNDYTTIMATVIQNGYTERVPAPKGQEDECSQPVWYIPHHRVYQPKKPNKLRVVFNCSAQYKGE